MNATPSIDHRSPAATRVRRLACVCAVGALLSLAAPTGAQPADEPAPKAPPAVSLTIKLVDGESGKEVKDAFVDLLSQEDPARFSLKSAKSDGKGVVRFKAPPGKVMIQINAKDHDPLAVEKVLRKDQPSVDTISLDKRKS